MFTHTAGDPDRGDEVARAVLADDAARAEVVAPIADSVMTTTGLPPEQRPAVEQRVDQLLQQPDGARAFVDAFAGGWSRMLGEDDGRGSRVDVRPFVDDIVALIPDLDPALVPTEAEVPATVPIPRSDSSWLADLRTVINALVVPLAVIAAVGMAVSMAMGDRRWAGRRIGIWAALAGGAWVVVPFVAVAAARQWATGADEVVRVGVDQAFSGLRPAAIVLALAGVVLFVVSLPGFGGAPQSRPADVNRRDVRVERRPAPARSYAEPPPTPTAPAPPRHVAQPQPARQPQPVTPTMTMPVQATHQEPPTPQASATDDDSDDLWSFYTEPTD